MADRTPFPDLVAQVRREFKLSGREVGPKFERGKWYKAASDRSTAGATDGVVLEFLREAANC